MEQRLIDIEIAIANLQKTVDELNSVVFKQGNTIDKLTKENKLLATMIKDNIVNLCQKKPLLHIIKKGVQNVRRNLYPQCNSYKWFFNHEKLRSLDKKT